MQIELREIELIAVALTGASFARLAETTPIQRLLLPDRHGLVLV